MKQIFSILAIIFLIVTTQAQTPEKMSYQAVIRNSSNALVINTTIGMQISILQGSASGAVVYTETQTPTTNTNGLVSIEIGDVGFSTIDWSNDIYFIKTETDPTGGSNYTITGTSQLLSVPYALHAKTAETVTGKINITETDPNFTDWDKSSGITITESQVSDLQHFSNTDETDPVFSVSQAANVTTTDITNLGNLSGTNTGDQDLSGLATKSALGDSTAQMRSEMPDVSGFVSTETDPEYASWDKSTGITISESQITDLQSYLTTEVDGSVSNEGSLTVAAGAANTSIINSNTSGQTGVTIRARTVDGLNITESGNVITLTANDKSETNELQTLSLTNRQLSISGSSGNTVTFTNWDVNHTNDVTTTGNQTIAGNKTFTGTTTVSEPVNAQDAATKAYVDSLIEQLYAQGALRVRDYDGNYYNTIKVGNQIWMAENLKTTHYANGDSIPDGTAAGDISGETDPQYWFAYNNDLNNVPVRGSLYTWFTVVDSRNVCPAGWHVPANSEWSTLINYLGDASDAGGKLKETGIVLWTSPNTGATNESGFTATPAGYRKPGGGFSNLNREANFWTNRNLSATNGASISLIFNGSNVKSYSDLKTRGLSVRCVKD